MKINFLEICQPEYFAGHWLPVVSLPVYQSTTQKDLSEILEKQFKKESFDCALREAFREIEELQNANFFDPTEIGEMHVYFTIQ